jgi:hypothetical protein
MIRKTIFYIPYGLIGVSSTDGKRKKAKCLLSAVFNTPLHTRLMSRGTLLSFLKRMQMV